MVGPLSEIEHQHINTFINFILFFVFLVLYHFAACAQIGNILHILSYGFWDNDLEDEKQFKMGWYRLDLNVWISCINCLQDWYFPSHTSKSSWQKNENNKNLWKWQLKIELYFPLLIFKDLINAYNSNFCIDEARYMYNSTFWKRLTWTSWKSSLTSWKRKGLISWKKS